MMSVRTSIMLLAVRSEWFLLFSHRIRKESLGTQSISSDPNCGAAFKAAEDDTALGLFRGCSATNPSVAAKAPTVSPVCV